jgi:hypothetical protein
MAAQILGIIGSALLCVIGLWRYFGRKNEFKRKQAEQSKKDLEKANEDDDPSSFLDAFGRT